MILLKKNSVLISQFLHLTRFLQRTIVGTVSQITEATVCLLFDLLSNNTKVLYSILFDSCRTLVLQLTNKRSTSVKQACDNCQTKKIHGLLI